MHQMLCPVLVGREEEVELLRSVLDRALSGHGGVVLITGDAGMGKSRLANEARAMADALGMTLLRGRAASRTVPVPLRPLVEAFQALLPLPSDGIITELDPFRPVLGRLLPQLGSVRSDEEVDAVVLDEAVTRLLALAGRSRVALLVLEDLIWADAETLEVVAYLRSPEG